MSSLTIALALVDDSVSLLGATVACNGMVWTYCAGFMLTFAAIYVKLFKVLRCSASLGVARRCLLGVLLGECGK